MCTCTTEGIETVVMEANQPMRKFKTWHHHQGLAPGCLQQD